MRAKLGNDDMISKTQEGTKEYHLLQESRVLCPHDTCINWNLQDLLNVLSKIPWK